MAFDLRVRARTITPLMEKVERVLRRIAKGAAEMPNNPTLCILAGSEHRGSVFKALHNLQAAGRLTVEQHDRKRRVVFPGGLATGWGEARPGHKPYCRRKRGEQAVPRQRKPQSLPMPARLPVIPPSPIDFGIVDQCQWPMWGDGERATGVYCSNQAQRGRSFCLEHNLAVHGKAPIARVISCV